METRNIIGIVLIIGAALIVSIPVWDFNGIHTSAETNQTKEPIPQYQSNLASGGGRIHAVTIEIPLPPKKSDKIKIYKPLSPHYTRQDIITLGEKFNMSPDDDIKGGEEGYGRASKDRKIALYILNQGWMEYTNSNRNRENPIDVPGNLPSDDEAVKIATKFLKGRDLLPEGAEFIGTSHGKIHGWSENGTDEVCWEDINVWYGRTLNGYAVEGTQLMLAIGGNGDPIEFFRNWRNYEPYQEVLVKTPDDAFEELKTRGVAVGFNDQSHTVSIKKMYLAYHTKAGSETEEYLEPVWVFKGNEISEGKSVRAIEEYVSALPINPETTTIQTVTPTLTTPDALVSVNVTAKNPGLINATTETPTLSKTVNLTPS